MNTTNGEWNWSPCLVAFLFSKYWAMWLYSGWQVTGREVQQTSHASEALRPSILLSVLCPWLLLFVLTTKPWSVYVTTDCGYALLQSLGLPTNHHLPACPCFVSRKSIKKEVMTPDCPLHWEDWINFLAHAQWPYFLFFWVMSCHSCITGYLTGLRNPRLVIYSQG